jgi:cytochrome oxidase Cu insertion factor (SCO1/SenC/PrrC family)
MNTPIADTQRRRGRRQLLLLASLFFVPLLLAFWLYYGGSGWRPAGGTNKGDLINPAVPLPSVALAKPDGTRTPATFLQGKWTIAYVGDGACDERCHKALYLSRQTWISLNKDMDRVQRVFLATGPRVDTQFVATEHGDLLVAILGDDAASNSLLAKFPVPDGAAPAAAGRLYLIDPLGNLVLSYSAAAPDKALLTDVKKLLRLSHIG